MSSSLPLSLRGFLGKPLSVFVIVGLSAIGLTACDTGEADVRSAASKLAEGLAALDVSQVVFVGEVDASTANQELQEITASLGEVRPDVSVDSVAQVDGSWDTATATLNYQWSFESGNWEYQTTARLSRADAPGQNSSGQNWGASWSPELLVPGLAKGSLLQLSRTQGQRGKILGDNGEVLVQERPVLRVGIDKTALGEASAAASARALAELVEIDPGNYAAQVAAAGPQAFVQAIILRDDQDRRVTDQQISAIPGAVALRGTLSLAPNREFARAVLGTVGAATAELIDASGGRLQAGDQTGIGGLQQRYDELLSGEAGLSVREVPVAGSTGNAAGGRVLFSTEPKPGQDLQITLNTKMQNIAQSVLAGESTPAALVAIRPSTGSLLAVASGPGSQGYDTALQGRYAPGSTFKIISSLALLREGMTPDSQVQCPSVINAGGTSFRNYPGYPESGIGQIPLRTAFANSCNTAFIGAASRVSQQELSDAAAALGVGVPAEIGLDSFDGSIPAEVTEAERAASMIGQGKVLVSPLTMARVAASVGQGSLVQPRLVLEQGTASGSETPAAPSAVAPLTAAEDTALKSLMGAVVSSGNAGSLNETPGPPVIAKTGTAEYGSANPPQTHAWLVAVQGDLAVAMFVENARGFASQQLSPLMQKFFTDVSAG